jgi:hypothetical protein
MFNILFLVSAILFVVIDFIYLNLIKNYFANQVKIVQGSPLQINLLGTVLFEFLQDRITANTVSTLSIYYQDLLNDYIKNSLIWYGCVEYIPFSSIQFKSNGAVKQQSEQAVTPSKGEIDYLLNKALNNADYYALRLQNYLIAYSNEIPQYLESVGNQTQIYPDQTNQYFGGIQL